MSDGIEFNEEHNDPLRPAMATAGGSSFAAEQKGVLFRIVKKFGVTSDTQAQYILLGFGLACLAISMFIIGYFVFGVGKLQGAVEYNIPDEMMSKFPPDIQKQIIDAKRK